MSNPGLDLGALGGSQPLTLSTLDGARPEGASASPSSLPASFGPAAGDPSPLPASFGPPPSAPAPAFSSSFSPSSGPLPASFGPPAREPTPVPTPPSRPAPAAGEPPADLFAPPAAAALEVVLDTDVRRREPRTSAARPTAVPEVPWPAATLPPRVSETRGATLAATSSGTALAAARGLDPRLRLVAGAVLAVGLGFIPAHFVGAAREKSAYGELDAELTTREAKIRTRADYDAFTTVRADYADRKRDARQSIALLSLGVWVLVGGGVAWLFFRRISPPTF